MDLALEGIRRREDGPMRTWPTLVSSPVGVKLVGTSLVKIMLLVAPPGSLVSCSAG